MYIDLGQLFRDLPKCSTKYPTVGSISGDVWGHLLPI